MRFFGSNPQIEGVSLGQLGEVVAAGLEGFPGDNRLGYSESGIQFDVERAASLELTPDQPYAALSESPVLFRDVPVGALRTFVLSPDQSTPQPESDTVRELHLPLGSVHLIDDGEGNAEKRLIPYAGYLEMVKADALADISLVHVGQNLGDFFGAVYEDALADPKVTFSVGEYQSKFLDRMVKFGEEMHLVNNQPGILQVCGLIAFGEEIQGENGISETAQDLFAQLSVDIPDGLKMYAE